MSGDACQSRSTGRTRVPRASARGSKSAHGLAQRARWSAVHASVLTRAGWSGCSALHSHRLRNNQRGIDFGERM